MKVLLCTFTYPPNADGVSEASAVLARGLAARGHSVTVATAHHAQREANRPDANPRVEQFKVSGMGNRRVGITGECREYQDFIRNFKCDVIVFELWDYWSTHLALPLLKDIQAKKVLVSHGYTAHIWVLYHKFAWGLGPWLGGLPLVFSMPFVMRKFDHVVFLSHRAAWDRFLDHWVAKKTGFKRYSIIPNGAYLKEFTESSHAFRTAYGIGPGPMLLCVANYVDRKNQMLALRAFRRAELKDATLVFIGSEFNDYSRQMEELDKSLKLKFPNGRVLLLEKVTRAMTCAAYRAADLFVLSAKAETQPIVLLEAMASRTPFISTNTGCVRELPGGVVVTSEQEMVAWMRDLVRSTEKREKLAAEGSDACRKVYDWERVVESYDLLLKRLVGEGRSAPRLPGAE